MLVGSARRPFASGEQNLSAQASRCLHAASVLASQHAHCAPDVNLAFVHMGSRGATNDINTLVRGLHFTLMHARRTRRKFQMVVLPPPASEQSHLGMNLTFKRPWHWAQQYELSQIFNLSECHVKLSRENASWLERVAMEGFTQELIRVQHRQLVSIQPLWNSEPEMPAWLGPDAQRWWWSVLTTHLVKVRGDLERRVLTHPAIEELARAYGAGHPVSRFLRSGELLRFEPCKPEPMLFDVGLHIRHGDACGALARPQPARRCIKSLAQALGMVSNANISFNDGTGRVKPHIRTFLASDSDTIVKQVAAANNASDSASTSRGGFAIQSLTLNRSKYEGTTFIEMETANERRGDRSEVLIETLLDLALLARSDCIAGSIMGNLPRLALQLRVRPDEHECYVSLDHYRWCTQTKCGQCRSSECVKLEEWRGRHRYYHTWELHKI